MVASLIIIENGKSELTPNSDRIVNGKSEPLPKNNDQNTENRSQLVFDRTRKYVMTTHRPMQVALSKADGVYIWDIEGRRYYDFTSCLSTVNIGHRHPNVLNALFDQVNQMTISIRSYHSQALSEYGEYITKYFGYDKVITLNSGNEAGENALRLARRWGYAVKKIPANQAKIICSEGNFLGNTLAALSSSSSPYCYEGYGPYMPGFELVPYNDLVALEEKIKNPCVCAFVVEPIQAHHGVNVPDPGYLKGIRELCTKYNCLMVADEAATGLGRTGKLLACHHENVRPDIVCIAKSLGGGVYPVSAVLADNYIMAPSYPGELGSTYGGNPLACRIAMAVLQTIHDENLPQRAEIMGEFLRKELRKLPYEIVKLVRGRGLLNAIVLHPGYSNRDICMKLKENGLLAEVNTSNVIRLSPPLNITKEQILDCIAIIHKTFQTIANGLLIINEIS